MAMTHVAGFTWVHQSASSRSRVDQSHDRPAAGVFPFLSLPIEIRYQIYRELLVSDAEWIRPVPPWVAKTMTRFPRAYMIRPWPHPKNAPDSDEHTFKSTIMDTKLFLVCKQIYQEALPILLEENPVVLSIGLEDTAECETRIESVLTHARVLALKLESLDADSLYGHDTVMTWLGILQRRTNVRTLRVRFMDRNEELAEAWLLERLGHFQRIKAGLMQIRVCAVATVECHMGARLRSNALAGGADPVVKKAEELGPWLEKELASVMRRAVCPCPKRGDGRHADRVEIGRGSEEPVRVEEKGGCA